MAERNYIGERNLIGEIKPGTLFRFANSDELDLCMKIYGNEHLMNLIKKRPATIDSCSFYVNLDKAYVDVVHNDMAVFVKR